MYYYLTREIKRRIMFELRQLFRVYPGLEKFKVTDKFPYQERPQYGVVVKNSSGETIPLDSSNFISTRVSHCNVARVKGKKGLLFDWVREDVNNLCVFTDEDVSAQADGNKNYFTLSSQPVQGNGNIEPAVSTKQVLAKVNNLPTAVTSFNGLEVTLANTPPAGAKVVISYYKRNLVPAGLYYIEVVDKNKVMVDRLLDFSGTIIESATGIETTYQLPKFPVYPNSVDIFEDGRYRLTEGTHYTIDLTTGVITWLSNPDTPGQTLRPGNRYYIEHKYQGPSTGPFDILPLHTGEGILPGVTLAFSNWVEVGDKQVVLVTDKREQVAREFGGHFDMTVNFEIYSRDPMQRELIADLLAIHIWGVLKPNLDGQGLLLKNVVLNGETEDEYDEATETMYFKAGIDLALETDWRLEAPMVQRLKFLVPDVEAVTSIDNVQISFVNKTENII